MDFGVVLQTDPPAWRVVDLAQRAETLGFSHGWAFVSHILWQEPYVIFSQMLSATKRMIIGPMVTNPGTRNWTVTASHYATLNDMFGDRTICGIGRGDSAMRVLGHTPTTLATLSESMHVIKELAEGRVLFVGYADVRRSEGWLVQGVYTFPHVRRRGLASAGMSALVEEAFLAGADHVQLAVVGACFFEETWALGRGPVRRLQVQLFHQLVALRRHNSPCLGNDLARRKPMLALTSVGETLRR